MAKLTAAGRKRLKPKQFALSGGRYPIEDKNHARNALARASEEYAKGNLTAGQLKEIHAKAKAKLKERR